MRTWLGRIGALRLMLHALVVSLILMAPFAGAATSHSGWAIWPTLIAPSLVPMLVFVLPLDMTMCAIYMSDKEGEERRRYRFIIRADLVLMAAMVLAWAPFFYRLVTG